MAGVVHSFFVLKVLHVLRSYLFALIVIDFLYIKKYLFQTI